MNARRRYVVHSGDACLAAFAMVGNCRLVSLDGDLKRFAGLDYLHLTA